MNQESNNLNATETDSERRAASRRRTLFSGKIIFNQQSSIISCIARNVSETGACLEIDSPVGVPDQFELLIEGANIKAEYCVIWRRAKRIGVSRIKDSRNSREDDFT